jgi:proteasome lid subunit RPN8/RPN11
VTVAIAARVLADVVAHARDEAPNECCGLLVGDARPPVRIESSIRARNARDSPAVAYLIDPRDHFAAIRQARAAGQDVVGAYHSHPRSPPRPSATDLAEAHGGGFVYVIVSLADEPPSVRAFVLDGGNFAPLDFVPCPK